MKKRSIKKYMRPKLRLDAKVKFFFAEAHGGRIYTNEDADGEYKNNRIHDPKQSTYVNLFVNGVLQPDDLFSVRKGKLMFKSEDVPEEGTPIVLQFVKLFVKRGRLIIKKGRRRSTTKYTEE